MKHRCAAEAETRALAAEFVHSLPEGAVVLLQGDLGAGKTAFVRGMLEGLGWQGAVTSPTYTLMQEYPTEPPLVHADLYRLEDPDEVWGLDLEPYLESRDLFAVEWSERVPGFWPADAWRVDIRPVEGFPEMREIQITQGAS